MKILHINSYFIAAPLYKNLYDKELELKQDIDVYVPVNKKTSINHERLGEYSRASKVFSTFDRVFFYRKHKKILSDIKETYDLKEYDIIHAHSLFSNGYIALQLYKEYGIPYIVAVRNTDVNVFFKKMIHLRKLGREIIANAKKVIFISEPYKKTVIEKYVYDRENTAEKSLVIPNGINDFWIEHLYHHHKDSSSQNIKILAVGDIDKNKNHITTLKTCESLSKDGYDVEFNIVGRILNQKIFNTISKSKLVHYRGTKHKEELMNIYRDNDLFIMPSWTETFGLVYAEAMSQGVPVIYTKGQGFDQQFPEGLVGYHVVADDYQSIKKCIQKILCQYNEFSKQCCISSNRFNWKNISEQYIKIYEEVKNYCVDK